MRSIYYGYYKDKWERTNTVKDKEYLQGNIKERLLTAFSSSKIKVLKFIDLYLDFRYAKNA